MKINETYLNPTSQCHGYHESLDNNDTKTEKEPKKQRRPKKVQPVDLMSSLNETTQNPSQSMATLIGVISLGLAFFSFGVISTIHLTSTINSSTAQIMQEQKEMRTELRQEQKDTRIELKQDIRDNRQAIKTLEIGQQELRQDVLKVNTRFDSVEKLLYILVEDKLSQAEDSPTPKEETDE